MLSLEEQQLNTLSGISAIKFGAAWCGPCKLIEPNLIKLEAEFTNIKFYSVDVDKSPSLAKEYQIRSLPTIILLKDGREIQRINGAVKIEPLRKAFRDILKDKAA